MAPVIHEWTYEAMAYDLLDLKDDTFRYTVQTGHGAQEMQALLQVPAQWLLLFGLPHAAEFEARCHEQTCRHQRLFRQDKAAYCGSGRWPLDGCWL